MVPRKRIDLTLVVQTAVALANANGFEAVTLVSVAEQLGIRIPSLYNHVDGLNGLRYQMRLWGIRQLAEALRRAAVGKAGDEAVLSVASAYRQFAHQNPGVYSATLRAAAVDEPELEAVGNEIIEVLIAVLQPYRLGEEDALHAIRGLRSILHGFVDLETSGGFAMSLAKDESFRQLVAVYLMGLHARQGNAEG